MQKISRKTQAPAPTRAAREMTRSLAEATGRELPVEAYAGNQAALRRLSRTAPMLQRKLAIGAVDDPLEAEADRVADRVMRMPASGLKSSSDPAKVLRRCGTGEKEDDKKLRMKSAGQGSSRSSNATEVLRRDPAPDVPPKAAADESKTTPPTPDAGANSITVTIPWDEYILKTLPLIGTQMPKLQMQQPTLPGIYSPPPISLGPQQPPSTGPYTLPPGLSPAVRFRC